LEKTISHLDKKSVKKVISILQSNSHPMNVIELEEIARSAVDAANSLDVEVGAIVKTLVFVIRRQTHEIPVIALVAGDKRCNTDAFIKLLNIEGKIVKPDADRVKEITGYSIGAVSPIGLPNELHLIIDSSLKRFETIWSAAGHTHCVFAATYKQLKEMTNATESDEIT
jgi:prolyl-tRNA editing enzyme YbaK/EbsC (Cys-tRNA(Pro) deacylase)